MLPIILWTYSLLVFGISSALCIRLGYRRGVFNSALRLGSFLLSSIIAFGITRLLVNPIGNFISELVSLPVNMPSVQQLAAKLLGGLAAPLIFMVLFFVIDKLSLFAYIPLKKKFADNEKLHTVPHDKLFGALLGFVLAFCITLTCVMPIGYLSLADETLDAFGDTSMSDAILSVDTEPLADAADTAVVKADYAISGWLLRGLTSDARGVVNTLTSLLRVLDALQNAEDVSAVTTALQSLPPQTVTMMLSVAQEALTELLPEDAAPLANAMSTLLKDVPEKLEKLSGEAYNKELEAIANFTTALTNPDAAQNTDILETVLSSALLRGAVVENSEVLAESLSDMTEDLSKKEKNEIKNTINEYADEFDMDSTEVSALLSVFGIQ